MPAQRLAAIALSVLLLTGCSGDPPTTPGGGSPTPDYLTIEAACDTVGCRIPVGSEWAFSAVVVHTNGSREIREAEWATDDAALATVDPSGRVRAIRSGTTIVRAKVGTLTSSRLVQVQPRSLGSWKGRWVPRACSAVEDFDPNWWCRDLFISHADFVFDLTLREEDGRLSGGMSIGFQGGFEIDEGSTLDQDGNIRLSAQGDGGLGWFGPVVAVIEPFKAQIRGSQLEGRFTMKVIGEPGSRLKGAVTVEADLQSVTQR